MARHVTGAGTSNPENSATEPPVVVHGSKELGDRMANSAFGGDAMQSVGSFFSGGHAVALARVLQVVGELTDYIADEDVSEEYREDARWIVARLQETIEAATDAKTQS